MFFKVSITTQTFLRQRTLHFPCFANQAIRKWYIGTEEQYCHADVNRQSVLASKFVAENRIQRSVLSSGIEDRKV